MSRGRLWVGESIMASCVGLPLDDAGRLSWANWLVMKVLSSLPLWIGLALLRPAFSSDAVALMNGGELRASWKFCKVGSKSAHPVISTKGRVWWVWCCDTLAPSRHTRGLTKQNWNWPSKFGRSWSPTLWWCGSRDPSVSGRFLPARNEISSSRRMWRRFFFAQASTSRALLW